MATSLEEVKELNEMTNTIMRSYRPVSGVDVREVAFNTGHRDQNNKIICRYTIEMSKDGVIFDPLWDLNTNFFIDLEYELIRFNYELLLFAFRTSPVGSFNPAAS